MLDKPLSGKRKTRKKSEFTVVDKEEMEFYGKMIMLKQISYNKLLERIKEDYPDIKTKRPETLRYFMITNHFVLNEKSLDNINLNVEKTKLVQKKREKILESLMEKMLKEEEFLDKLFEIPFVKRKIQDICKEK